MELNRISVGQKISNLATGNINIQITYRDPHWELIVGFPGITKDEIREIQYGTFLAAPVVIDGVLFWLSKFGDIPWSDCPFEPRLASESAKYNHFEDGEGAPMSIMAVDTNTGEIKAIRIVGLTHTISNYMSDHSEKTLHLGPLDRKGYYDLLEHIYAKYQQSDEMLSLVDPAHVICIVK